MCHDPEMVKFALREGLRGQETEELAVKLMAGPELHASLEESEAFKELRQVLNRMLVERINTLQNEAIEASKADPSALQRYRELQTRKLELEALARAG